MGSNCYQWLMRAIIIPGISFNPGPLSLYVESCGNGRDSDGSSVANMFGYSKYFCGDMANMGGDLLGICSCIIIMLILSSSCLLILLITIVIIHVASVIVWRNEGGSLIFIFTNITTAALCWHYCALVYT